MAEPTLEIPAATIELTAEQRQALAECVAIVAAHPHLKLSKRPTPFLLDLWATVALDETVESL